MHLLFYVVCGAVFGAGLAVSQMLNPQKVLNFLDFAGEWDPSLAFVMGAAVAVTAAATRLAGRRERPLLEPAFAVPTRRDVDARLLGGAAIFGVGWGLVGLCPGPTLANLGSGVPGVFVFFAAMLTGIGVQRAWQAARSPA